VRGTPFVCRWNILCKVRNDTNSPINGIGIRSIILLWCGFFRTQAIIVRWTRTFTLSAYELCWMIKVQYPLIFYNILMFSGTPGKLIT